MNNTKDPQVGQGLGWLTLASLCIVIQVLVVLGWTLPQQEIVQQPHMVPELLERFKPEHEVLLLQLGVGMAVFGQAIAWALLRRRLQDKTFLGQMRFFSIVETVLVGLLLSAQFKTIIYDYRPLLAKRALGVVLILCVLHKWKAAWFQRRCREAWQFFVMEGRAARFRYGWDGVVVVLLTLLLYIPDHQAAVARIFIGEQACHMDHFIMAPGWAYLNGALPYIHVLSEYGVGVPVVLAKLSRFFGEFSYEGVFQTVMWLSISYTLLYYLFLRLYFRSILLSLAAVILGIKFIFFYTMSYPLVYTYPSSTPARYWVDVLFFLALTAHVMSHKRRWLLAAVLVCAASLFYVTTIGICLAAAFYLYLALVLLRRESRPLVWRGPQDLGLVMSLVVLIPAVWIGLYWMVVGQYCWSPLFWDQMKDFLTVVSSGYFTGPFWTGLYSGQMFDVIIGCLIPILYLGTFLAGATQYLEGKSNQRDMLAVIMAFYGLGVFHHHVAMSMANNYYTMGMCLVFVMAFWIEKILKAFSPHRRTAALGALTAAAVFALCTNHHFISFPNIFNFSANPMVDQTVAESLPDRTPYFNHKYRQYQPSDKVALNSLGETDEQLLSEADFSSDEQLKEYYRKEYDFSRDAALITKYTNTQDPVALISSFEVKILMQAKRKPFFYHFLLMNTRPMRMRIFGITNLFTKDHLARTIGQMESQKPSYVFMERIFLTEPTPKKYDDELYGLMEILRYVKEHYIAVDQGQYLVAMRRKDL